MSEISARKRLWGWLSFDWATQPFYTLLLTFIFGPYFAAMAAEYYLGTGLEEQAADARAQSLWSVGQTITGLIIAFTAPILGALADTSGRKMPWIFVFSVFYIVGTCALWCMIPDGSMMVLTLIAFGVGMLGAEFSLIFVNALMPSLAEKEELGNISGTGFALGYAGGVVSLFIMLLFFAENESGKTLIGLEPAFGLNGEMREGTRSVGPFTALWFIVFMAPFFLWVRDDRSPESAGTFNDPLATKIGDAFRNLASSIRSIFSQPSLGSFLLSSMFYRDALNGLYAFGGIYATLVLDWSITKIGIFGVIGAISAAVFTWIGGRADRAYGPKPLILSMTWILIFVCTIIVGMSRDSFFGIALPEGSYLPDLTFFVMGALIGACGGALQAASRTMMVRQGNPDRPTEAFGLYALSGKATAFLAPSLIGLVTYMTESARYGLAPVIGLFIIGLVLLRWVDPDPKH